MAVQRGLDQFLNEAQEYLDNGDTNNSLQTANKAHEMALLNDNLVAAARALNIISLCYFELNNKLQSLKKAKEAMEMAKKSRSDRQITYAHFSLAKGYFLNNQIDQSEIMLNDGLIIAHKHRFGDLEVKMLGLLQQLEPSQKTTPTDVENDQDELERKKMVEQTQKRFDDDFGPGKISFDIQETENKMDEIPLNSSQQKSDLESDSIGENPDALLVVENSFSQDTIAVEDLSLGYEDYANAFVHFLSGDDKIDQLVIGLHGEWGRGKSTLMQNIQEKLKKRGFTTHWLNAWKYDNEENIWGALLNKLIVSGFNELRIYKIPFYYFQLYRHKYFISLLLLSFVAFATYSFFPNIFNDRYHFAILLTLGSVLLSFTKFIKKIGDFGGLNFRRLFGRMGDNFNLGIVGIVEKDLKTFQNIYTRFSSNIKPIVVFIDDLDRCPPDKIVLVVNAINTLTLQKGFIFFIGYDRDFVAAAISSQYGDIIKYSTEYKIDDPKFGYKFLDKIIQIPFRIPIGGRPSILKYIEGLLNIDTEISTAGKDFEEKPEDKVETETDGNITHNINDNFSITDDVEIVIEEIPTEVKLNEITLKILEVAVTDFNLNNPRSIKKFMNMFKLLTYIAYESKLLIRFQISPIQIGYYLVFHLNYPAELNYIVGFLQNNLKIRRLKPDELAKINEVYYSKMTVQLNKIFNKFTDDSDFRKFDVIRNLVGKSITS